MAEITAVTFDLWQTLLLDNPERGRIRSQARLAGTRDALARAGQHFTIEDIDEAYRAGVRRCQEIRETHRDVTFLQQVQIFVNHISPRLVERISSDTFHEIAHCYSESFFEHPPGPHPEGVRVLQNVQNMGLRMGMISNTGMTPGVSFRRFLDEHGMLEYFDVLTFSDEVGYSKPSCEIFNLTLSKLGSTPAQAIHVGDHFTNDVAAARSCGLKAIWIDSFSEMPDQVDPESEPDVTVSSLGEVPDAISRIIDESRAG
ncbi:MAG: HAD family hydrolase [Chloroflexota bacterium]|nr:HAD family hydrolase [Chloroflexota bacterium]